MMFGSPSPRKDSELSSKIACATMSEASTIIGGSALGRMWRVMIWKLPRPDRLAASTNSRVLSDSTSPRTRRATGGHDTMEIAMMTKVRLGWKIAKSTIAKAKLGIV